MNKSKGGALGAAALGHLLPPSSLSDQRALCELVEGFVLCLCALTLGYVYGSVPGSLELEKFAVFVFCWCFPVLSFGMWARFLHLWCQELSIYGLVTSLCIHGHRRDTMWRTLKIHDVLLATPWLGKLHSTRVQYQADVQVHHNPVKLLCTIICRLSSPGLKLPHQSITTKLAVTRWSALA